jgi:hypothetical protein
MELLDVASVLAARTPTEEEEVRHKAPAHANGELREKEKEVVVGGEAGEELALAKLVGEGANVGEGGDVDELDGEDEVVLAPGRVLTPRALSAGDSKNAL